MNWIDSIADWFDRHRIGIIGTIVIHFLLIAGSSFYNLEYGTGERIAEIRLEFEELQGEEPESLEEKIARELSKDLESVSNQAKNLAAQTKLPANYTKINESEMTAEEREQAEQQIAKELKSIENEVLQAQREAGYGYTKTEAQALISSKKQVELDQVSEQDVRSEGAFKRETNITYKLEKRYDTFMEVPVYRCQFSGEVVVNIAVDREGRVASVKLDRESTTTTDNCLINAALAAAKGTLFNSDNNAPKLQRGMIHFRFVPQ